MIQAAMPQNIGANCTKYAREYCVASYSCSRGQRVRPVPNTPQAYPHVLIGTPTGRHPFNSPSRVSVFSGSARQGRHRVYIATAPRHIRAGENTKLTALRHCDRSVHRTYAHHHTLLFSFCFIPIYVSSSRCVLQLPSRKSDPGVTYDAPLPSPVPV